MYQNKKKTYRNTRFQNLPKLSKKQPTKNPYCTIAFKISLQIAFSHTMLFALSPKLAISARLRRSPAAATTTFCDTK
jgi:hypothetical protein